MEPIHVACLVILHLALMCLRTSNCNSISTDILTRNADITNTKKSQSQKYESFKPPKNVMSLQRLLELGEWRKFGARLRLRSDGKLEYHVAERYDAKRPGFTCTVVEHEMDIESHHEAYGLPTPGTSEPSICTSLKQFDTLLGNNDAPSILDDWIYLDRPALDIYIIKFANATLVRVTCCTFTWMGQQSKTCSMVDDSAAWPRGPSSPVPWV